MMRHNKTILLMWGTFLTLGIILTVLQIHHTIKLLKEKPQMAGKNINN